MTTPDTNTQTVTVSTEWMNQLEQRIESLERQLDSQSLDIEELKDLVSSLSSALADDEE